MRRTKISDPVFLQREYYKATPERYDRYHLIEIEQEFALAFMLSMIDYLNIGSVLDVGSGTGRALSGMKRAHPNVRVVGVEPPTELRAQGHAKGLGPDELIDGDAPAARVPRWTIRSGVRIQRSSAYPRSVQDGSRDAVGRAQGRVHFRCEQLCSRRRLHTNGERGDQCFWTLAPRRLD